MSVDPGTVEIVWSKLKSSRSKVPLVLLREEDEGLIPWVYSGEDETIYKLKWNSKTENMIAAAETAHNRRETFSKGTFDGKATDFSCESQCESRTNCPYWLKAGFYPDKPV